ncbi:hypothetical protein EDC04DRAFT_2594789, partial [Pisolithus marmoratus]
NYEEQVLLSCIICNWCPKCLRLCNNLDENVLRHSCEHVTLLLKNSNFTSYGIHMELQPFTNDFPCADIHKMLSPDILHQLIKGRFKDHLVDWVEQYLVHVHGKACWSFVLLSAASTAYIILPYLSATSFFLMPQTSS